MKTRINDNLSLLPVLIAGLGFILAARVTAQTFTVLHSFTASDGATPYAGLILSDKTLYGTADTLEFGGSSDGGTVFRLNIDGTGFTNLHSFAGSDGGTPYAGLILSGNTLYGTADLGGGSGAGTVFKVNTDGTGFTILHDFTSGDDGANPATGLLLSGNTVYGTAYNGGSSGNGTLFAVNTDGNGFTNLYSFTASSGPLSPNSDGAHPRSGLILSGTTLYGTASQGGGSGYGTVFKVNTDGTGFTNLHNFTAGSGSFPNITNSDGAYPRAGLTLSGNTLYGTAQYGGTSGSGTVFAINTNSTGFTNLHSFTHDSDGAYPRAGLILSGKTLYGAAAFGGSSGSGTLFAVSTNGIGFTNLLSFPATAGPSPPTNSTGANPYGRLVLSDNTLYGTTLYGGNSGYGTVFSLLLPAPQLMVTRSGTNAILTWPTNNAGFDYTGYTLQDATNLGSPMVWSTVSPGPVVANGQFTATNPISGTRKFYRLSQ